MSKKILSNAVPINKKPNVILTAILLITQACSPVYYKVPEHKEDYAYYGSNSQSTIEAIKYCHAHEDEIKDGKEEAKPNLTDEEKIKIALGYEQLRNLSKDTKSDKEYPIPVKKSLATRTLYYTIVLPIEVITFPIWIYPYLIIENSSEDSKKPKTVAEHIKFCDAVYKDFIQRGRWEEEEREEAERSVTQLKNQKAEIAKEHQLTKITKEKNKEIAIKYGYQDMIDDHNGLVGAINLVTRGELDISEAKQYLIKRNSRYTLGLATSLDAVLIVEAVVNDKIVYAAKHDHNVFFAMKKEGEAFYGKGSLLKGDYFAIVGKTTLNTNRGSMEMLVVKRVK